MVKKILFKNTKTIAILLLSLGCTSLYAQETTTTTGGNAASSAGSVSYSIGQVAYITDTDSNVSVAQGVQQAYEITIVTELEETKGIDLSFSAYPNPAIDIVKLKIENYKIENLSYQLFDINGKIVENKKLNGNETSIKISDLGASTYLLKIIQSDKEIKTFKIIKN